MADNSVKEVLYLNHHQVMAQEVIREHLLKVEAVANMALSEDFLDCSQTHIHAYMWALSDLISEVKHLHESAFNDLLKSRKPEWVSG